MAVKSQVLSLRVPEDSGLQARFSLAAKKACILPWELLEKMLNTWESGQQELSSDSLLSEIKSLRADLDETKTKLSHVVDNVNNVNNKKKTAQKGTNVDNVDNVDNDVITNFDVLNFNRIFSEMSNGKYDVLIPDIRTKLIDEGYKNEKVDTLLKHLRDTEQYQLQAAFLDKLTKTQLKGYFLDENNVKYWAICQLPKNKKNTPSKTVRIPKEKANEILQEIKKKVID